MTDFELLSRLGVALAIGLLVGLERGWRGRDEQDFKRTAGLRTFALTGLLGGIAGAVARLTDPTFIGIVFIGFSAVFAAFYWRESRAEENYSVTAVVAAMLTLVLGAYAVYGELRVAVACAVAMTLLLALREPLHRWLRMIEWAEIRAVLVLLAMTFLLLPVLPDRPVDPWNLINPAQIWLLAIMIAAISFAGYVAVKLLGARWGIAMMAFAGGLASSTATTVTLARLGKDHASAGRVLAGGILLSGSVMVARVLVIAAVLNMSVALRLVLPLLAAGLMMIVCGIVLLRNRGDTAAQPTLSMANPLELGMAIKLAALIALILVVSELVVQHAGDAGVLVLAALSGIADVDALTISMAKLGGGQVAVALAALAILLAVLVNTGTKTVISFALGGSPVGVPILISNILAAIAGYLVFVVAE